MPLESRNPSGTRIAITLGALVAAVMLGVWGVAALAGTLNSELEPGPKVTPIASAPASATSEATVIASAAVASATPAKPVAKPIPPAKPVATPAPKPAPTVPRREIRRRHRPGTSGVGVRQQGQGAASARRSGRLSEDARRRHRRERRPGVARSC